MNEVVLEAKNKMEAIRKAMESLNASEEEIIYSIKEEKGKLFKTVYTIKATTLINIVEKVKEYLQVIISNLGITANFESNIRDRIININIYTDKSGILIGKNGDTLKALEVLVKQKIYNDYDSYIKISIDIENYKEKRIESLERLAKKTAREVRSTKVEVTLENMNSFERRVIHNILTDFKGVTTTSEGEEPNRHVIIKPTD